MKHVAVFLILLSFSKPQFGQNKCTDYIMSIKDFYSKNILISDTKDSLLNKMGEPFRVIFDDNYGIVDSVYMSEGFMKRRYYEVDLEFKFFDGMTYVCYNDSAQLIWIDFTKTNDTLNVGGICFYKGLDMDTLLKECNMDTSCVSLAFDWYYQTHNRVYQVFFYSKFIFVYGFRFNFDIDTKKLWYAEFDIQRGDGIIH